MAGSIKAPGMVIQTVHKNVENILSVATAAAVAADIDEMFLAITPKYASSKILVLIDISGESNGHNIVFRLKRGASEIGTNSTVTKQYWVGWKPSLYDTDTGSTPQQRLMSYMDSPNTTSSITYQLQFIGSDNAAATFYLNRPVGGAAVGQSGYEIATSSITLMEIAQ